MATLILQTVGSAVGGALGGPIGAAIGSAVGSAAGSLADDALFGGRSPRVVEGPRLSDVPGLSSSEGEPIPRVYGRARIGGTLIWATRPLETANTTVERAGSGGKGGGGTKTATTRYSYFANLAVGLCAGPIAGIRRVWADGREIDLTGLTLRVHTGAADQAPDPLIVAKEGGDEAPAYRGLAYVVFENLALDAFGNRVPQFAFEVLRPVGGIAQIIRAVCLIPGSTEFGLDPLPVTEDAGFGTTKPANRFQLQAGSDVLASLDTLQALCPRLARVSVIVSWFGDDLRAGHCRVAPRVDSTGKAVIGEDWRVAGLTRGQAQAVSLSNGVPAYGGTPSDAGLLRLIAELRRRGLEVVLYPFVMMDVPADNARPDPRAPGQVQPPYPWRGRITCDPAPGLPGTADSTAAADAQVAAFFANGYRAFIRHYAQICAGAGLSGFILGSEFVGLTRVRGASGYPAVTALRSLAQEIRAVLGPAVALVYAADWTEYGADVRGGGASIRFPLDALFADPAIDAVGIDYYPPLSDWRDGRGHLDAAAAPDLYDREALRDGLGAGEAFDWYYASDADRRAQTRTPITDGAYNKPWIYRAKDLAAWWSNPHVERENGVETQATAWQPRSKPIWLTEIGVPAVDRGTNGPNVFPDPKSSESAAPPFSRATRDDLIQARGLEAILTRFDAGLPGFRPGDNPVAPGTGLRMVDPASIFVWCWDARPFPAFPDFDLVWSDAGNWSLGHWINGRAEGQELDRLIQAILTDHGIDAPARIEAAGFLDGFVIDRPLSARGALEPLVQLFGLDVSVSAGTLSIRDAAHAQTRTLVDDEWVRPRPDAAILDRVRAEESERPRSVEVRFIDAESAEYRRASAAALRPAGARRREIRVDAPIVTRRAAAQALAESVLDASLAAVESARFSLSPRRIDLEPGDRVRLPDGALHRIARIADSPAGRRIETHAVPEPGAQPAAHSPIETRPHRPAPAMPGPPFALALDLPVTGPDPVALQWIAAAADPWPGRLALWRAEAPGAPLKPFRFLDHPACLGQTLSALPPGPLWRFDRGARLDVHLRNPRGLGSVAEADALSGANSFALRAADGTVEIVSAAQVELIGPDRFRLSCLLRGLAGSEPAATRTLPTGSLVVRLDDAAVVPLIDRLDEAGRRFVYRLGPADRDPADPAFAGFEAEAGLIALRPRAPVHLRARRMAEGIALSWVRRARRDADSWDLAEIPLDEPAEQYRVEILDGAGMPLRSLTVLEPRLLYATADEAADFGSPQAEIRIAVVQLSAIAGPGEPARAVLPVAGS